MARKVEVDLKLLIVAVAFVIIATVGSAFTTYLIFRGSAAQTPQGRETTTTRKELGPTHPLGEFTLNLYLYQTSAAIRTEIVLETSNKKVVGELEKDAPGT